MKSKKQSYEIEKFQYVEQLEKLEFDSTEVTNNELQNKKMGVV